MPNRRFRLLACLIALILTASVTACGGTQSAAPVSSSAAPAASSSEEAVSSASAQSEASPSYDPANPVTSEEKPVYTVGEMTAAVSAPVLVTSAGRSADTSMMASVFKKAGLDCTLDIAPEPSAASAYKTIFVVAGASSKGLGNAGISIQDELTRTENFLKAAKDSGATVVCVHLGGTARRGDQSDQFAQKVMAFSSYLIVVEAGNQDGLFTSYADANNIPYSLLYAVADGATVLKDLFA